METHVDLHLSNLAHRLKLKQLLNLEAKNLMEEKLESINRNLTEAVEMTEVVEAEEVATVEAAEEALKEEMVMLAEVVTTEITEITMK